MAKKVGKMIQANGTESRVIKMNAMSLGEKTRIETLVHTRATNLSTYLQEMENFANEAAAHTPFSKQDEMEQVNKEIALLNLEKERIKGLKTADEIAVKQVIQDERDSRLQRLKALEQKTQAKAHEELTAATAEIEKKYNKKQEKLLDKEIEFKGKLEALLKIQQKESLIRKMSLREAFSSLGDSIKDGENQAIEQLYTEAVLPEDAKKCLQQLPDAIKFRQQVTPDKLFNVLSNACSIQCLPMVEKLKCRKCGHDDLNLNRRGGEAYCPKCGCYDAVDLNFKQLVQLPTLEEIMNGTKTTTLTIEHQPHNDRPNSTVILEENEEILEKV